jgi:membrane fusion protein, multidrug efflux system
VIATTKAICITTGICLLAATSCSDKKQANSPTAKPATPPAKVDVFVAATAPLQDEIEVPGSLAPFEETTLQPEISGRVTGIFFKEGSAISKGSLLVKLYDADLLAQLKKLRVQLEIAEKTEQRQAELLRINGISQQDYDLSLLSVNNLQADIDILKTSIAKTELRAPFSGRIGLRNISMGAYINPQTIVATLSQVNQLKLDFTVPERYSSQLGAGSLVKFKIDGSQALYNATVMASENNITANTRSLRVKAVSTSTDAKLTAGAFAKVVVPLGKSQQALMIPTQAIIPQAKDKKVIVSRNGVATMEVVTTGVRNAAMIEITSGLKTGDTVLVTGLLTTKPGAVVKINKVIGNNNP